MIACHDCAHHIPRSLGSLDACDIVRDPVGNPMHCLLARMTLVGECGPQARYFLAKPAPRKAWYKRLFA
jgi:hypothetical protein